MGILLALHETRVTGVCRNNGKPRETTGSHESRGRGRPRDLINRFASRHGEDSVSEVIDSTRCKRLWTDVKGTQLDVDYKDEEILEIHGVHLSCPLG